MATGDYIIRGNASNTDVIPATGSDLLLEWPTAIANVGSGITHSAGVITLGETGHFLVMCSDHANSVDNTNNERIAYKQTLTLAGVELVEGYSHAYIRKNDVDLLDYITFSAAIINVTTTTGNGDELEVRCARNDDVILTGPVRVVDDRVGITIIKLDDTLGYGRYQSSAVTATSATDNVRTVMNIQTQDEQDSPFTRSTNNVDIATGNLVLAVYSIKSEDAGAAGRSEFQSNLFLNGSVLAGSWNHQYCRSSQDAGFGGSSSVVLLNPTSGWDVNVGVVSREGGGEDFEAALQLVELPAGAEAIIVESAAGNYNTAATNFNWPNASAYEDSAAFTFSSGQTNIDVDNAGDYIAMASMGDSTDAGTTTTRAMPALQFRINTTDVEHVGCTSYHRANGTADHSSLSCATLLNGLSANDSIHCRNDLIGNVGAITNSSAQFAVIRLSSLAGGPTINTVTLSDNAVVSDPADFLRLRDRETLSDFAVDDALLSLRLRLREAADSITATDNDVSFKVAGREIADSLVAVDNAIELRKRNRIQSDSAVVADFNIELRDRTRQLIDSLIVMTDSITGSKIKPRLVADSIAVSEDHFELRQRFRELLSAIAVGDDTIGLRQRFRELIEDVAVTDTTIAVRISAIFRTLLDAIELIDNHIELRNRMWTLLDSVDIVDSHTELRHRNRELFDSIVVIDNAISIRISATFRTLLSTIDTIDSSTPLRFRDRLNADEATVQDVSNTLRERNRLSQNSLLATDSIASLVDKPRLLVDTLDVEGGFIGLLKRARILTDNPAITDSVIATYIREGGALNDILLMDQFDVFDFVTALKIQQLVKRNFQHDIEKLNVDHSVDRLNILTKITRET